jgi:hypothetical protein
LIACARILQYTKQRPNIAFRYAIASHKESHRSILKQFVQRWLDAAPVKHDFLPPQFRHGESHVGQCDADKPGLNRQSHGWCGVNCECVGLSLAVLAPLPSVPQRKSLNWSEKIVCNLGPCIPCQKMPPMGSANRELAEVF